jgi:hypothetical protein
MMTIKAHSGLLILTMLLGSILLRPVGALAKPVAGDGLVATASSEWGVGYGAAAAADGVVDENSNYWQTVQGKDKRAWWQADLGEVAPVHGVRIAWARYEDKYHSPPAGVVIQVSATGAERSWKDVLMIGADNIPRDEAPYEPGKTWDYPLPESTPARYVRLLFPDGDQAGAKYEGYICLGEVEVKAPGLIPQILSVEAAFGKVEVNVTRPSLAALYLRGADGLSTQSLLAKQGRRPWARGGCTYVVAEDGKRYESRLAKPENVELVREDGRNVLRITGVKLACGGDVLPAASEDWTLSAPGDGSRLVWKIVRRWLRDVTSVYSGSPGLFFCFDARTRPNSTTSALWYDPLQIVAASSDLYASPRDPGHISENHLQLLRVRDTWAIFKLWTNWPAPADLRLEARGGYLYRRGSYAHLSEAGVVTGATWRQTHQAGQTEEVTLEIGAEDKHATGYQLAVELPDKETEAALKRFYDAVFNGGAVNDQKGFDFGNETDGWYYAGSCWMYGATLAAGVPEAGALSAHPYDAARAFREHLAHVLSTLDDQGRAHFGYNQGGEWVDDNLHAVIGVHFYLLHSGDLDFIRQCLPAMERMIGYFVQRRNSQGLFKLDDVGAHWYYDAITTGGVNGYYNAFLYRAATDLAEMEEAAGCTEQARTYRELADTIKAAFNQVLWKEDAPGGPRYLDWIDAKGREIAYFCDLCQWPPIAVGIASPEQARKIVATADARIAELEKEFGYAGYAGLSALWPVPKDINPCDWQTFGRYMNGGSLLCQTYWEIMARAKAGDAAGAAARLRRFARRAGVISWAGDNAADIHGEMKHGDGEPYLADMVCVTAATIHGVLGIQPTWQKLEVTPCLPPEWPHAEADILYKGRRHHVTIVNGKVQVQREEQIIAMPLLWVMDFNLRKTAYGVAHTENVDFVGFYGDRITLSKGAVSGTYESPVHTWGRPAELQSLEVAADLCAGQVTATVETSNDGFKTVQSRTEITLRDGVSTYPLDQIKGAADSIRVGFTLVRPAPDQAPPLIDAFRVTGGPTTSGTRQEVESVSGRITPMMNLRGMGTRLAVP